MQIAPLSTWNGLTPQWIGVDGRHWLSRGPEIYRAEGLGETARHLATVPDGGWKRRVWRLPLAERLLRYSVYNLIPRSDGSLFVSFDRGLWIWDGDWHQVTGLARACRVLRGCVAKTPDGAIWFGEYFPNRDRSAAVHIYTLPAGEKRARIVHTFAAGEVRHVHGVHWDPVAGELWSLTGDLPGECRVQRSPDGFATLHMVGTGDESWRGIYPIFAERAVYYATDAEFAANHIYRIDRASWRRDAVGEIDGPSDPAP